MTTMTISEAAENMRLAEKNLERAKRDWHDALAADNVVEELARRLYLIDIEKEGTDSESIAFYEKISESVALRDQSWQSLLIDIERDEYRDRAKELLDLAREVGGGLPDKMDVIAQWYPSEQGPLRVGIPNASLSVENGKLYIEGEKS